jgi:hypothetical protein
MSAKMPKASVLPPGLSPRGLNLKQAAEYWGVCPSTFKTMVKEGIVKPIDMGGVLRNIFDRQALDDAMSARAVAT